MIREQDRCDVCGFLGCCPYRHIGKPLSDSEALRFARSIIADNYDGPRAKMLAEYIVHKLEPADA